MISYVYVVILVYVFHCIELDKALFNKAFFCIGHLIQWQILAKMINVPHQFECLQKGEDKRLND